jgi:Electron transfer DM13
MWRARTPIRHPITWLVLTAGVDLSRYRSVSIWCARFQVSFGTAELTTQPGTTP